MDPAKVAVIQEWNTHKHVKDIQAFLGLAIYYRRFILSFSLIANPLTQLFKKDLVFTWIIEAQHALVTLK